MLDGVENVAARDLPAVLPAGVATSRFSLLEMLVVVAIIAVTLAVALPNMARLPARIRGQMAAGTVRDALSQSSLRARTTGETVRLTLNVDGDRSSLVMDDERSTGLGIGYVTDFGSLGRAAHRSALGEKTAAAGKQTWTLPEGLTWGEQTTVPFTFHPNGEAGGPHLTFAAGKRRYVVDVERLTGRPDVYESAGD